MIGILGGMGPQAGIDLATKITAETNARVDQEHVTTCLYSPPDRIPDRTSFLLGGAGATGAASPAPAIAEGFRFLERSGALVAGMACNTAHAPPIFDAALRMLEEKGSTLRILHLIEESVQGIQNHYPEARSIGILGTRGTFKFRLYDERLEAAHMKPLLPDDSIKSGPLNDAIYHPDDGLKARSAPVSSRARASLLEAIDALIRAGADAVILGCTELPLAVPERVVGGVPIIDPARFLARALIRTVHPDRLKPWNVG